MGQLTTLVIVGTLAISAISAWDAWHKYKAKEPGWKVVTVLAVGSLLVSVLAAVDGYISAAADTVAAKQLENAQTVANNANAAAQRLEGELTAARRKLVEVAARVEHRVDLLTPEALQRIVARLRALPPKSLGFVSYVQTRETQEFADKLEHYLKQESIIGPGARIAGVSGEASGAAVVMGGGGEGNGVIIQHNGHTPSPEAVLVHDALVEAGIPGVRFEKSPVGLPSNAVARMRIKDR